jgi:hypothetical protein
MKTSRIQIITALFAFMTLLGGCYYDNVIFPEAAGPQGPVSFAGDVIPIFQTNCAVSGCHITGGQLPDLTTANAYNSLILGNFVSTSTPKSSPLYRWMAGLETLPMPPSGSNLKNTAIVLAWIEQGAQNN